MKQLTNIIIFSATVLVLFSCKKDTDSITETETPDSEVSNNHAASFIIFRNFSHLQSYMALLETARLFL